MNFKWVLPFLFIGCAGIKPVAHQPVEKKTEEKKDTLKTTVVTTPDVLSKKNEPRVYTVSLLLPFHVNELPFDSLELNLKEIPVKSTLAIHYYEGILMALDTLDKLGLKLKLNVYDSKGDSNDVKEMLKKKPGISESDAIIGPVMNSGLTVVSKFAKENKKLVFSPLSATSTVKDNPYFVMANASLCTHCEAMANYIAAKYKSKKVFLLYHHGGSEEVCANYFKDAVKKDSLPFKWLELTEEKDSNYLKISNYLSSIDENIIVIPSFDEAFVNVLTKQLYSLKDDYKIMVLGMPTWPEMESLRTDYLEGINTHISNSYWVNDSSASYLSFKKKYFNRFKSPVDYTIQGYDLMFFIGSLMLKYADEWPDELTNMPATGLGDHFEIKPCVAKDAKSKNDTQYLENKSVDILMYSNNTLIKVN